MDVQHERSRQVLAALFVDFDNVYISLDQQDKHVASQFATRPDKWLARLEQQMPITCLGSEAGRTGSSPV